MSHPRILIAGIGNIFFGDDAFGVEVARRLAARRLPEGVRVVDFGIRGFDLAYALLDGPELAILVDATPRGGQPGTLYVVEPDLDEPDDPQGEDLLVETHGMNPMKVLRMVKSLGGQVQALRVVGCEPAALGSDEYPLMGLSPLVLAAVDEAIALIESLVKGFLDRAKTPEATGSVAPEKR
jgi:hydrogenase maturation protease